LNPPDLPNLCARIVVYYEGLKESVDQSGDLPTQEYTFLKQIIVESQPKRWEEVKQLYQEKLKAFPYVQKGS
jgi:hypothetical protein